MKKTNFNLYIDLIKNEIDRIESIDAPYARKNQRQAFIHHLKYRRDKLKTLNRNYPDVKSRARKLKYPDFIAPSKEDLSNPAKIFRREAMGIQFSLLDDFLFRTIQVQKHTYNIECRVLKEIKPQACA